MKRHHSFSFPPGTDARQRPRREVGGALGSGRWAQMARAVGLSAEAPLVVALSGGRDSVYLLHVVAAAKPRPRLVAVHVDHGLRGEESREDGEFCARLCASLAVPFVRRQVSLGSGAGSVEARARAARYRALCEEAAKVSIATIATGHHADDALETLLHRWMRGSDVHGLRGPRKRLVLPPARASAGSIQTNERCETGPLNPTGAEVQIVRPLLAMRREEIRRILTDAEIAWREDGSNASSQYTRNRIRNDLLPAIEATCGPEALENLRAFGQAVEQLEDRLASVTAPLSWSPPVFAAARRAPSDSALGGTLRREDLLLVPAPIRRRALWRLLVEGTGHAPSAPVLGLLLADLAAGRATRRSLAGGWSLQLRSDLLHLEPPAKASLPAPPESSVASEPQLDLPFLGDAGLVGALVGAESGGDASGGTDSIRLDLPGLVTLPDGRQITAEIVYLPPGTDVLRSGGEVEIDATEFVSEPPWCARTLWVRMPRAGDRFHPLGAPGSKTLTRFLADVGIPREDRGRVPLVFAGDELVWVAGIRPSETGRVGPRTEARLRLALHAPAPALAVERRLRSPRARSHEGRHRR